MMKLTYEFCMVNKQLMSHQMWHNENHRLSKSTAGRSHFFLPQELQPTVSFRQLVKIPLALPGKGIIARLGNVPIYE